MIEMIVWIVDQVGLARTGFLLMFAGMMGLYAVTCLRRQEKNMQSDPIIGQCHFADGYTRPVFQDAQGQYVHDDDGNQVRGLWLYPDQAPDEPHILAHESPRQG